MKIEIGESLFYSWLRHVKECQLVQTNWKVSAQWELHHEEELQGLLKTVDEHFQKKYTYNVFKKNSSMSQIIQQGECDVLGISYGNGESKFYAVDVAFHEAGLNYGSKEETVMKVIAKSVRTAVCLYGYLDTKTAEVVFASPKINPAVMKELLPCISDLNQIFRSQGYEFSVRVIANSEFNEMVLQPILLVSGGIADTTELFIRSYQMYRMFSDDEAVRNMAEETPGTGLPVPENEVPPREVYGELKIGKLVQMVLKPLIVSKATEQELCLMQEAEYSKKTFGIQYPLLLKASEPIAGRHYYKDIITVRGEDYRLCCEWYETTANNDRPLVEKWIREHES